MGEGVGKPSHRRKLERTRHLGRSARRAGSNPSGDSAPKSALKQARALLGPRALIRHRPGTTEPCVILRAEQGLTGRRYEIEYGRGSTWAIALQRAAEGYQAMVNAARRKKAG